MHTPSLGEGGTWETMAAELSDIKGTRWTEAMKKFSVPGVRETESTKRQP
jgi:hypothetical protein